MACHVALRGSCFGRPRHLGGGLLEPPETAQVQTRVDPPGMAGNVRSTHRRRKVPGSLFPLIVVGQRDRAQHEARLGIGRVELKCAHHSGAHERRDLPQRLPAMHARMK